MPGILQGFSKLSDEGLGTVTINELSPQITTRVDLGPDPLTVPFGPGADAGPARRRKSVSAPVVASRDGDRAVWNRTGLTTDPSGVRVTDMFLGIDLGTSAVKAVLVGEDGDLLDQRSAPISAQRPRPGWSEQNPED